MKLIIRTKIFSQVEKVLKTQVEKLGFPQNFEDPKTSCEKNGFFPNIASSLKKKRFRVRLKKSVFVQQLSRFQT